MQAGDEGLGGRDPVPRLPWRRGRHHGPADRRRARRPANLGRRLRQRRRRRHDLVHLADACHRPSLLKVRADSHAIYREDLSGERCRVGAVAPRYRRPQVSHARFHIDILRPASADPERDRLLAPAVGGIPVKLISWKATSRCRRVLSSGRFPFAISRSMCSAMFGEPDQERLANDTEGNSDARGADGRACRASTGCSTASC